MRFIGSRGFSALAQFLRLLEDLLQSGLLIVTINNNLGFHPHPRSSLTHTLSIGSEEIVPSAYSAHNKVLDRKMSYLKQFTRILRGSLSATPTGPVSGSTSAFHLPVRKLVLRYSQHNPSSSGLRTFIRSERFSSLTRKYPSVEWVVDEAARDKHPLVTGWYSATEKQGRRKDVGLANLDANQVERKVLQVVESSGAKVKSLKRRTVESKGESARGVWSWVHGKRVNI